MPSIERIRFVSSGTEAAMSTVRVARAATGCDRIVKFEGAITGTLTVSRAGRIRSDDDWRADEPWRVVWRGARYAPRALQRPVVGRGALLAEPEQIAAVLVEPIAGTGRLPLPPGFLEGLRDLCDREHEVWL